MAEEVNMTGKQIGTFFPATYWVPRCKEEYDDGRRCDLYEAHHDELHDHFGETPGRRVMWIAKGD